MKACILHAPGPISSWPLSYVDYPAPESGSDELLVRVSACAVCRTDLHVIEGELPAPPEPVIPGHQIVGKVVRTGERAEGFSIGDRVGIAWLHRTCGVCRFCLGDRENLCERAEFTGWTVPGGYAEYTTVPAAFAYPLPDSSRTWKQRRFSAPASSATEHSD